MTNKPSANTNKPSDTNKPAITWVEPKAMDMDIDLDVPKMDVKIEATATGKVAVLRVPLNLVNPPVTKSGKSYMVAQFSDVRGQYRFNGSVYRSIKGV